MIVRVLFGLLLFSVSLQGQTENDYGCAKTMLLNYKASNVKKLMYPEDTKVIKLSNISEVNNSSPENLLASVLSASSLEWYNLNRITKRESSRQNFEYIKSATAENYYFLLDFKIEFRLGSKKYAIVKHTLFYEDKFISTSIPMQQIKGQWLVDDGLFNPQLVMLFMIIDKKYLDNIFSNEKGNSELLNSLLTKHSDTSGFVDLELLLEEIIFLRSNQDDNIFKLTDKNSPIK